MEAVILAAGKGKKLKPFTDTHSKAMAPIAGKPIVHRVIDKIYCAGIKDFVVVIAPSDIELKKYLLKKIPEIQISIAYQNEQLGMGHALKCAMDFVKNDFLVSACDTLVDNESVTKIVSEYSLNKPDMIFALDIAPKEKISRYGIVDFDENGNVKSIIEKPKLKDASSDKYAVPLYIFSVKFKKYLNQLRLSSRGEYEIQDAISLFLRDKGPQPGIFINERYDLTTMEDLDKINKIFMNCLPHATE